MFVQGEVIASGEAERKIADGRLRTVAWSPASSLWGRLLNFDADRPLAPRESPSIVRTPLVIAMWEPFARALGYPKKPIGFEQVLRLAREKRGFAAVGKPQFGDFKLVHTNPDFSTSGLSAVVAEYYAATGRREGLTERQVTSAKARGFVRDIERSIVHYGDTTLFIADQMRQKGPGYASAVAMEEVTLLDFNRNRGSQPPLVALYPPEGTFYSDNPYITLDAPWVKPEQREAAEVFQRWLAKEVTPQRAGAEGFRPAELKEKPVGRVTKANGADPAQPKRVLGLPEPRVLNKIKETWRRDRKPANVELVVDVSGSMTQEDRLERAKQGLEAFFRELSPEDRVGLTVFSDRIQRLAPIAPFSGNRARLQLAGAPADRRRRHRGVRRHRPGPRDRARTARPRADQRRGGAHRRRGHRLVADRRRRGAPRSLAGRLARPGARVHDRLQRRGRGRARGADRHRQGQRRPGLRGQHRGHRDRLPEHLELLLMDAPRRPYSRSEYNRALLRNALLTPFAVILLAAVLIAGILLDLVVPLLPVALVVYGLAAGRTYFDDDVATKVLERERGSRREQLERKRVDPNTLAPPIRDLVNGARQRESRIREAISRAEMPYAEVTGEVDAFLEVMEASAGHAQLLYETLAENPPDYVEQRMEAEERAPGPGREYRAELVEALGHQLTVLRRMEVQLRRYYDEMERVLVELDTVRGSLVSASASTDTERQRALAADVRGLREEVGTLSEGMSEAYESPT